MLLIAARFLLVLLICLFTAAESLAKTLYVNSQTGNDATSYAANSLSSPWRTIGRAAWGSASKTSPNSTEAARAGDVVQIAGGTYVTIGNLTGGGGGALGRGVQPRERRRSGFSDPLYLRAGAVCADVLVGGWADDWRE